MSNRDDPKKHTEFGGGTGRIVDKVRRKEREITAEESLVELYLRPKTFDLANGTGPVDPSDVEIPGD